MSIPISKSLKAMDDQSSKKSRPRSNVHDEDILSIDAVSQVNRPEKHAQSTASKKSAISSKQFKPAKK